MNTKIAVLLACLTTGATVFASDCDGGRDNRRVSNDGVFMQNGRVRVSRNGSISELNQEVNYSGGHIMSDGTIVSLDGSRSTLRDNQWVTLDGPYGDTRADSKISCEREHRDGYYRENGKVMVSRNGKAVELAEDATLDNGTRILHDGTLVTRDGSRSRIEDNQRVELNGTLSTNKQTVNAGYRQNPN